MSSEQQHQVEVAPCNTVSQLSSLLLAAHTRLLTSIGLAGVGGPVCTGAGFVDAGRAGMLLHADTTTFC